METSSLSIYRPPWVILRHTLRPFEKCLHNNCSKVASYYKRKNRQIKTTNMYFKQSDARKSRNKSVMTFSLKGCAMNFKPDRAKI